MFSALYDRNQGNMSYKDQSRIFIRCCNQRLFNLMSTILLFCANILLSTSQVRIVSALYDNISKRLPDRPLFITPYFHIRYFRFSDDLRPLTNASDFAIHIHGWLHILFASGNDRSPSKIALEPFGLLSYAFISLPDRTFVHCANLSGYRASSAFSGPFLGPLAAARCALVACLDHPGSYELLARYCLNFRSYGKLPELSFIRQTHSRHICYLS